MNNSGNSEKMPDTEATMKVRKKALFSAANKLGNNCRLGSRTFESDLLLPERNQNQKDGFLVHVPTEHERRVSAQCQGSDKGLVTG